MATALERIGDLLVQKGLLTREQLDDCLREVAKSHGSGKPLLLSDVIVSRGFADRVTLTQSIAVLAEVKFRCSKCRTPYTIRSPKIDAPYVCKRCGAPLEAEDVAPSVSPEPAAASSAPAPSRKPPEVVEAARDPKRVMGKYTLVRELGRGGMAVVYQAWDEQLDQFVALKLIRSQDIGLSDQPEDATVQEFLREARTAVKLQHPNIVRVYELGRHDDRYFLSMEYVQGRSLADLLRTSRDARQLPFYADVPRYLGYLRDVALALDYTHHRNPPIVHRDIKPQNILIEEGGRVCVVDFGLAKELKGAGQLTRSGIAKGTPCYMAPEQATGKAIDGRTDVYALGAILYECLAGRPPFTGPSEREILNRIVGEEAPRPSSVLKEKGIVAPILPDLEQIALKALEKTREKRYRGAAEFGAELARFLEGQSIHARPISPAERSWRWLAKRKAVALSSSAAVLMAVVALIALFRGRDERIVERVKVVTDVDPARRAALDRIDRLEAEFRYDAAAQACEALLVNTADDAQRGALRRRRDDDKLQAGLFNGLSLRINPSIPAVPEFRFLGEAPSEVRFVSAEPETLKVERGGRVATVSWAQVDPHQLLDLVKVAWPEMAPRSTLALGVWCLRQGLSEEAMALFSRPGAAAEAAESRRYQEELKAKELKPDLTEAQQVTRLVTEAEAALAKGDLIIARARFERALILTKEDPRVLKGLEKIADLERKKEPSAPAADAAPAAKPAARKAETRAFLKIPGSLTVRDVAALHSKMGEAIQQGDLSGAATAWSGAQKTLGARAVAFDRIPNTLDLQLGRTLLDDVEAWLSTGNGKDDLALRQVFALRDLLVLSAAYAELNPAIDRLIRSKAEVSLSSLEKGRVRKGTLERSRGKLFLSEVVTVDGNKGTIGTTLELRGSQGKALSLSDIAGLLSLDRLKQQSTDPGRRLGEALLMSYDGAGRLTGLEELQKDIAGKPEDRRYRLKEYLELRADPVLFRVDLLGADYRTSWTRSDPQVELGDSGLTLRTGPQTTTHFEGFWLESGMRLELKARVVHGAKPEGGQLDIAFVNLIPGAGWAWTESANFFPESKPADVSFYDLTDPASSPKFVRFPYEPGGEIDITVDCAASGLTVTAAGTRIGTVPSKSPPRRLLAITARLIEVRFTRIAVVALPEAVSPEKASAGSDPAKSKDLVNRGLSKFNSRDFQGAIQEYTEALASSPADPAIYILRGEAHLALNEQSAGQSDMEEAIRVGGKSGTAGAYLGLGRIRLARRDFQQAISSFTEALAQTPRLANALRLRAVAYAVKEMFPQALEDLAAAMKIESNFGTDFGLRGIIAYRYGQWSQCASDCRSALQYGSWNDEAMAYFLWMARCRLGERVQASVELRNFAAARNPSTPQAAWCLKIISCLLGDLSDADLVSAAATVGDGEAAKGHEAEAHFYIGTRRLLQGNPTGARDSFKRCMGIAVEAELEIAISKAELARLDGKPEDPMPVVAEAKPAPGDPAAMAPRGVAGAGGPVTKLDEAVQKGIVVLRASLPSILTSFDYGGRKVSHTELAAWTLLSAGVPPEDRDLHSLIASMLESKLEATISVSLQAMVLERVDRVRYQKRLWSCAQFLVDNQSPRGAWGYGSPSIYAEDIPASPKRVEKKRDGEGQDQIDSFFAAMGLRACRNAGIALPKPVLDLAIQWNRATQKRSVPGDAQGLPRLAGWPVGDPRGWCYLDHADHEAYGSATAASVAAQAIWASLWDDDGGKRISWKKDKSVADGLAWLLKNYSVTYNPGPFEHAMMAKDSKNQWIFYLFALEQAMVLTGIEDFGGHSWYADASKVLVEVQDVHGTWGGFRPVGEEALLPVARYGYSALADECFALLVLKKAGQPLPDTTKPKK